MKDEPVSFESNYSLSESIERLRGFVRTDPTRAEAGKPAVGVISGQEVTFWWHPVPGFTHAFTPRFRGCFVSRGGKIFLNGGFVASGFARVQRSLLTPQRITLIVFLLLTFPNIFFSIQNRERDFSGPVIAFLLLAGHIWFVRYFRMRWRKEIDSLNRSIKDALKSDGDRPD
jgi:hypothetical protein